MATQLIAGGGGPLGAALARRLASSSAGGRVVTVGRKRGDVQADLAREAEYIAVIDRFAPQRVFHLVATYDDDFDHAYAVNVGALRHLLSHPRTRSGAMRIVVVGSAAEYGAVRPDENPVRENAALRPVSVYGLTKAWQTLLAIQRAALGADVVIARVFNLDGTGLSDRLFVGRVRAQIRDVLAGARTRIEVGRLDAVRDYIDTEAAAAQLEVIAAHGAMGEIYNVGTGVPVSMRDVLARMLRQYGLDWDRVAEGAGSATSAAVDVPVVFADMARTHALMARRQ